ncbi:MAG: hypothetical protein LQ343_003069 [Gyalolechia ehrenbergii]|nr:MAG: hypothetical protein LQ343_003069 [Gyalolechia ehrenbergii]
MAKLYDTQTTAEIVVQGLSGEIANKVVLTTGVSPGGLGAFFNQYIAPAKPALLILAGRNPAKNQETAESLSKNHPNVLIRTLQLDLESLTKVREAAATVNSWPDVPHIDVLVNNAGIMACEYSKTEDGLERRLGSKGLKTVSLHPHVIGTNLSNHLDWNTEFAALQAVDRKIGNTEGWSEGFDFKTPSRGAATHIVAAFDPILKDSNGSYLQDGHIADPYTETIKPYALDKVEADKLWELSEKLVGQGFDY